MPCIIATSIGAGGTAKSCRGTLLYTSVTTGHKQPLA